MQAGWNKHSAAPTSDIPAAPTEGGGGVGEPRRGNRGMRDAKRKGKVKCSIALGRLHPGTLFGRVAELGSLSSGAKMAMKVFVKRGFTIFATNPSFCA